MDRAHGFGPCGWEFDSPRARFGPLAQLVEHLPLKETVRRSIRRRLTDRDFEKQKYSYLV